MSLLALTAISPACIVQRLLVSCVSDSLRVPPLTFSLPLMVWSQLALLCDSFCEPWYSAYALCLCSCSAAARTVANNPFTFLKGGRFSHVVLPLLKHLCLTKINYCLLRSPLSLLLLTSSLIFILSLPRRKKKLWFLVFRFSKLYSKGSAVINIASFGFNVPKSL